MKIRVGFVSNSSSTSFVIIGSVLSYSEALDRAEELIKKGRLYIDCGYINDGADFFPLTKEMWKSYNKYGGCQGGMTLYDVQKIVEDGKIRKDDIEGDEFEVFTIEIDYHGCETLKEFQDRYLDMPPDPIPEDIIKKVKTARKLQAEIKKKGYNIGDIP